MLRPWWDFKEGSFVPPPQDVDEDQGSHSQSSPPMKSSVWVTNIKLRAESGRIFQFSLNRNYWISKPDFDAPGQQTIRGFVCNHGKCATMFKSVASFYQKKERHKCSDQNMQHALWGLQLASHWPPILYYKLGWRLRKCYNEVKLYEATLRTITQRRLLGKRISTGLSETSKRLPCEHTINWF